MNKLLKIAQESEEVADAGKTVQVEPGEDAIIITGKDIAIIDAEGDAVADSVEEAEEKVEEADELEEDIVEAEDAVEALEAIAIVLEGAIAKNSLDKAGVKILKIATESIYARLDMPESQPTLAMEAISEHTGGFSATIALEDMKERIAKIWEAIKAGLMKVMEYLRAFGKKIMDALPSMENRANKLVEISRNLSGTPAAKDVGNAGLVKALAIGNTVPRNIGAELENVVKLAIAAASPKVTAGITKAGEEVQRGAGADPFLGVISVVMTAGLTKGEGNEAMGVPTTPSGCEAYASQVLLGNAVVWSHVPTEIDAIPSVASGVAVGEVNISADKLAVLSPAEITKVAKAVLQFTALKEQIANLDKTTERVNGMILAMGAGGRFLNKAGEGDTKTEVVSTAMKEYFAMLRAIKALLRGVHQPALQIGARACAASLNYASASAKAYGAPANLTKQLTAA